MAFPALQVTGDNSSYGHWTGGRRCGLESALREKRSARGYLRAEGRRVIVLRRPVVLVVVAGDHSPGVPDSSPPTGDGLGLTRRALPAERGGSSYKVDRRRHGPSLARSMYCSGRRPLPALPIRS